LAALHEIFSQEDQKDRRRAIGVRAAAGAPHFLDCAPQARRTIKPSDLLIFL